MRSGPKGQVTAPPFNLRRYPRRGGARATRFIERYVTVPKGTGARRRMKLRPWQREIISGGAGRAAPTASPGVDSGREREIDPRRRPGLYGLLGDQVEGAQVLVVASDERQARIIFTTARRMVELNDDLRARVQVFADHLLEPRTSVFMALPPTRAPCKGGIRAWP